jgi:hypothetical protein
MLSDDERAAGRALVSAPVVPERDRYWKEGTNQMFKKPAVWHMISVLV